MSKKAIKKPFSNPFRAGAAVFTFGASEGILQGGKALGKKAGLIQGQPDAPNLPTAPTLEDPTLDQAANEEELKRKRRANIATRPLGVLVQQALQTRTLTGQ